jgi:cytoskeletal protein RodZ
MDLDDAELETQLRETLHRAAAPVHGEGVVKEAIRNEVARRQNARQRTRWTGRLALAAAVAAAAAVSVLVLTRPDQDRVDIDNSVVTQPTVPPTTAAPDPSTTETPSTTPSATSTTAPGSTTPGSAAPPALPEFPPEDPLGHGKPTWGLYLVVLPEGQASVDSAEFQAAQQAARDAGYSQAEGYSGISCDEGAAEGLGVDPNADLIAPAVYFATEAQADEARTAFEARGQHVAGIAHVTPYCLD